MFKVKFVDMAEVMTGRDRCKLCKGINRVQITMSPRFGVAKLCRGCRQEYNIKSI